MTPSQKNEAWIRELTVAAHALDRLHVHYFLDMGTLLGAVRDGAFIPWDNDIDLGVISAPARSDALLSFCKEMFGLGYEVHYCGQSIAVLKPGTIEINLALYTQTGEGYEYSYLQPGPAAELRHTLAAIRDGSYHGSWARGWRNLVKRVLLRAPFAAGIGHALLSRSRPPLAYKRIVVRPGYFERLEQLDFLGQRFPVPAPISAYLESRYGQGWKTPVREWNYVTDDRSIRNST